MISMGVLFTSGRFEVKFLKYFLLNNKSSWLLTFLYPHFSFERHILCFSLSRKAQLPLTLTDWKSKIEGSVKVAISFLGKASKYKTFHQWLSSPDHCKLLNIPPSAKTPVALTYLLISSQAKNTAGPAISFGSPIRPSGIRASSAAFLVGFFIS